MITRIEHNGKKYTCNLNDAVDISIGLGNRLSPKAFYAPDIEFNPYQSGDFIGSLDEGSPVNFYDIKINPHGNCTHTESALHIYSKAMTINQCLSEYHFISRLISVQIKALDNGDKIIDLDSYSWESLDFSEIDALVIRTLPNEKEKKYFDYSGKNPCYFDASLLEYLSEKIDHLLIDLPSVDREIDGGKLLSHNAFWNIESEPKLNKTITELIFVEPTVKDGRYLLNIQTIPLELDASPSRPVLYPLTEE